MLKVYIQTDRVSLLYRVVKSIISRKNCINVGFDICRKLFDYAFNSFDSIEVDGKAMTVPKGVTAADLTMESKQKGKKTLNQYYYQGQ